MGQHKNKSDQILRKPENNKRFYFEKGDGIGRTTLDFTLRVDIKTQLRNYAELLKAALADVEEELKRFD